ncbi:hypothetical protein [Megasphaera massiliensis]|uniref:hypothetical protein n=3 Tax=Megasphaera TaxID=906 RepID=UPI00210A29C2|nr:hypothetical protein [Megasphaera massiliensis]MCQ5211276.1 hypothetical protein [Megasphaera massiliensis]
MKQGMFKQVLSAMVLTMSLAGGAAFVSADSIQYSDNGDYKAAVIETAPASTPVVASRVYSEHNDHQAVINLDAPAANIVAVRGYSENGDSVAASAFNA